MMHNAEWNSAAMGTRDAPAAAFIQVRRPMADVPDQCCASVESFWSRMQRELLDTRAWVTTTAIVGWIEAPYNPDDAT